MRVNGGRNVRILISDVMGVPGGELAGTLVSKGSSNTAVQGDTFAAGALKDG